MAGSLPVTVVVPTRDEAHALPSCLAGLARFARVLVVDSGSADGTADIARAHGAEVVQFRWDGRYPKKRNWVLLTHRFATGWVLFLDADERVDDAFCDELAARLPAEACAGYWLTYRKRFMGRVLRHGVPQRKLALIRPGAGLYERTDEERWSDLDMEVHEHPVIAGPVGTIRTPVEHAGAPSMAALAARHAEYARWEARRFLALRTGAPQRPGGRARVGEAGPIPGAGEASGLSGRQRFKYAYLDRWWFAWAYFLGDYVLRLGVLDGRAGLAHARFKLRYFRDVRAAARALLAERQGAAAAGSGPRGDAVRTGGGGPA